MTGDDIQIENGNYTRIHNAILEALAKTHLSGLELRAVMFLLRKTYGFQKKEDRISLGQWAEGLGKDRAERGNVANVLNSLVAKGIIYRAEQAGGVSLYSFNKRVAEWQEREDVTSSAMPQHSSKDTAGAMPQHNEVLCQNIAGAMPEHSRSAMPQHTHKRKKETLTKEKKESALPPERLWSDGSGQGAASRISQWNSQVSAELRTPIANAILDIIGKRQLADIGGTLGDKLVDSAHENAVTLYKLGYKTAESLLAIEPAWAVNWRGKAGGGTAEQLVEFATETLSASKRNGHKPTAEPLTSWVSPDGKETIIGYANGREVERKPREL